MVPAIKTRRPFNTSTNFRVTDLDEAQVIHAVEQLPSQCFVLPKGFFTPLLFTRHDDMDRFIEIGGKELVFEQLPPDCWPCHVLHPRRLECVGDPRAIYDTEEEMLAAESEVPA